MTSFATCVLSEENSQNTSFQTLSLCRSHPVLLAAPRQWLACCVHSERHSIRIQSLSPRQLLARQAKDLILDISAHMSLKRNLSGHLSLCGCRPVSFAGQSHRLGCSVSRLSTRTQVLSPRQLLARQAKNNRSKIPTATAANQPHRILALHEV